MRTFVRVKIARAFRRALPLVALAALPCCGKGGDEPVPEHHARVERWDAATLELAGKLPVQEGGRVKPLSTLAGFQLLKLNGKRKIEIPGGEKLDPTGWLLDCLFFPEQARTYPVFLVQNGQVLTDIGLEPRRKRDRYSYDELLPGRRALFEKAQQIVPIDPKERDPVQRQVFKLASDVHELELLFHELDFARKTYTTDGSPGMVEVYGDALEPGLARVLRGVPELRGSWRDRLPEATEEERQRELQAFGELSTELSSFVDHGGSSLALLPPLVGPEERPEWLTAGDLVVALFESDRSHEPHLELIAGLERMEAEKGDREAFRGELASVLAASRGLAEARGEYGRIPLEVDFYERDYFTNALALFLLGFLCLAGTWLLPGARWLRWGLWGSTIAGTLLVVAGITVRCIIRERPPVSTLYETILFIAGCGLILALVIEWINRARIAIALAPVLGALLMFLSMKYELKEAATAGDTMPSLVAVLDTNFWLATHVTTVTLGYAAGLFASAIAHVWLLGRMFGLRRGDASAYKGIARMVYGVICFGLLFSVVGTILGGIWANYSWGRFWGWDPKENGALLICLWELLILHSRMGGYIRDFGLAVMAVVGGLVVAFSWWGVNLLGVGLHSYGFTDGVMAALASFYALEGLVLLAALGHWLYERGRAARAA